MRVISGIRKGHKLKSPKGKDIRPTEDKIKESLFNILGPISDESVVLDLFGGTGQIGIEFLSRGARKVYFVDKSSTSIATIKENLVHTKLLDSSVIMNNDSIKALKFFKEKNIQFDYVYIDPPFKDHNLIVNTLEAVSENNLLKPTGLLIIEHENEIALKDRINKIIRCDIRDYKRKSLSFYRIGDRK